MRGAALIVLAWNQWPRTKRCLDSLFATDLDEAEVIVVDNGSADETPHAIEDYAGRVRYRRLAENLGFVRGMNAGIAMARPDDDVVLLNNDVDFIQRDWLNRLRDAAYADCSNGVVGCRLLTGFPTSRLGHVGGFIEGDETSGHQTESGNAERDVGQFVRTRRVQGIAFAVAYLRRDCIDRIGTLDPVFHSYFEDTDYCLRAAEAGIATVVAGNVTLRHEQHGSTEDDGGFRRRLWEASKTSFAARWQARLREDYRGTVLWQGTTRFPLAEALLAKMLVRRLDARGLRMAFEPVAREIPNLDDYRLDLAARRRWPLTPDATLLAAPAHHFARAHGRYRIGLGLSEWERVPQQCAEAANRLDRLIVPDAFQADAFRNGGVRVPIEIVPLGVDRDYCHPDVPVPRHPLGHFVFVAVADDLARDAPDLLVETFRSTFRADEPVELLLCIRPGRDTAPIVDAIRPLLDREGARVRVLDGWGFPDYQRAQLLCAGDAYISTRRGGGWDPLAAEALACGRPLIATAFGSRSELVRTHGHAVEIAALRDDPRNAGCHWAEPDRESLAAVLRDVFERRSALAERAREEAAAFAARHSIDTTADRLVDLLASGGTLKPARRAPLPHRPAALVRPGSGQIVVLGMHRSGTSSVASLLARMGAWAGPDDQLLSGPDNPKGHYESAALHSACLARLAAAGGDWRHPPGAAPSEAIDAFRREVAHVLDALDRKRPWLIKEPRLCLVARELLPLLTRPVFVHVVRDPLEVADSLARRDGLARAEALALWERYTREAFAASRGWPRVIVDYGELIADALGVANRLHAQLVELGVEGLIPPDAAAVARWIEPGLRSHRAGESADALTVSQRALLAAIADGSILRAPTGADTEPMPPDPVTAASSAAGG